MCGEAGHIPAACPRIRDDRGSKTGKYDGASKQRIYLVTAQEDAVTIEIQIGSHKTTAKLDTGATPSVMGLGTARQLDLEHHSSRSEQGLWIARLLAEMLSADTPICRHSKSLWASDVVLFKKRDGSLRFAVDYRRLNKVTKRDEYSLPNPQSIIDRLKGNRFFSKLDIASAYWTIPIREGDVE